MTWCVASPVTVSIDNDDGYADADAEQRERKLQRMPEQVAEVGAKSGRYHRFPSAPDATASLPL